MDTSILQDIGLTKNEIKIYLTLLKSGFSTAYELSKKTGIYRAHIYDKLNQLMDKGLTTYVLKGSKKYFQATSPEFISQYLEDKMGKLEQQQQQIEKIIPDLQSLTLTLKVDTKVEVFQGNEGIKFFLRDAIKTGKDILIMGINDENFNNWNPLFMKQYFRDAKSKNIKERVITAKDPKVFLFEKDTATTTTYRFLDSRKFNTTSTTIYGNKVVIMVWGTPSTGVMIENKDIADAYRVHFEYLWEISSTENK